MSDVLVETCANCGSESSDTVKLKNCTACRLVKYCSVDCQRAHRKEHKGECKKRAAELKDEKLFTLGQERPEGDFCPICTLPIPIPMYKHSFFNVCCMKRVCHGCGIAAQKRGMFDCPFCRTPIQYQEDNDLALALLQKRVDAEDPATISHLGDLMAGGGYGVEKNVPRAIELWTEAAELGSIEAHFNLGNRYSNGEGVKQDMAKSAQHWEKAAMKGHAEARCNLGNHECRNGNYERAVRHYLIAAKMGETNALDNVKDMFINGIAAKEQYAEALKAYQESVGETKSPERDEAIPIVDRMYKRRALP